MRETLSLALILIIFAINPVSASAAGIHNSAHDFRSPENGGSNTKYPLLAEKAGKNSCIVCHSSHSAFMSNVLFAGDFGWEPDRRIQLPSSALCMSCHDGDLKSEEGQVIIDNPDLRIGERHRRHRVEYPYPSREGHLPTYAKVEKGSNGRYWALGANGYRLPLDYIEDTGQTMASCITCHNAHDPGEDSYYLRTTFAKELCWTCHSESAKRME